MKKLFGLMLLCAMAVGFVSCEKGGVGDENNFANHIIGTWATTQAFVGGDWIDIPSYSDTYATMSFYNDGRYYGDSELFGSGWGTYTLNGKILTTYFDGELFYNYTIKSMTNTTAEVTMAYKNTNVDFRLKKL